MTSDCSSTTAPGDIFATTHWTVVLAAGRRSTPQSDRALEELCRTYWFPLYAYVRRRGHTKEDAEDLTQAFFARFLGKNYLEGLSAERGRFRAFLLASLKHFLINEWDKSRRQKRGGGVTPLSLDWQTADTQFQIAATAEPSPDKAFDREWAVTLLAKVIERLNAECDDGRPGKTVRGTENFPHRRQRRTVIRRRRARARPGRNGGARGGAPAAETLPATAPRRNCADPGRSADVDEEMRALFGAFC